MGRRRVAVERELTPVRDALEKAGYEVVPLEGAMDGVAAVVVSGMDADLAGRQDHLVDAPVISARGRPVGEIVNEVAERISAGAPAEPLGPGAAH